MTDISGNLGIHNYGYDKKEGGMKNSPDYQAAKTSEEPVRDNTDLNATPNAVYGKGLVRSSEPKSYMFDPKNVENDVEEYMAAMDEEFKLYELLQSGIKNELLERGYSPDEAGRISRAYALPIFSGNLKV